MKFSNLIPLNRIALTILVATVVVMTGCTNSMTGATGWTTAAAMRVEVEVYKGPLSKSVIVQQGELAGLAEELERAMVGMRSGMVSNEPVLIVDAHGEPLVGYQKPFKKIGPGQVGNNYCRVTPTPGCQCDSVIDPECYCEVESVYIDNGSSECGLMAGVYNDLTKMIVEARGLQMALAPKSGLKELLTSYRQQEWRMIQLALDELTLHFNGTGTGASSPRGLSIRDAGWQTELKSKIQTLSAQIERLECDESVQCKSCGSKVCDVWALAEAGNELQSHLQKPGINSVSWVANKQWLKGFHLKVNKLAAALKNANQAPANWDVIFHYLDDLAKELKAVKAKGGELATPVTKLQSRYALTDAALKSYEKARDLEASTKDLTNDLQEIQTKLDDGADSARQIAADLKTATPSKTKGALNSKLVDAAAKAKNVETGMTGMATKADALVTDLAGLKPAGGASGDLLERRAKQLKGTLDAKKKLVTDFRTALDGLVEDTKPIVPDPASAGDANLAELILQVEILRAQAGTLQTRNQTDPDGLVNKATAAKELVETILDDETKKISEAMPAAEKSKIEAVKSDDFKAKTKALKPDISDSVTKANSALVAGQAAWDELNKLYDLTSGDLNDLAQALANVKPTQPGLTAKMANYEAVRKQIDTELGKLDKELSKWMDKDDQMVKDLSDPIKKTQVSLEKIEQSLKDLLEPGSTTNQALFDEAKLFGDALAAVNSQKGTTVSILGLKSRTNAVARSTAADWEKQIANLSQQSLDIRIAVEKNTAGGLVAELRDLLVQINSDDSGTIASAKAKLQEFTDSLDDLNGKGDSGSPGILSLKPFQDAQYRTVARTAGRLSSMLMAKATYWAQAHTTVSPKFLQARQTIVTFANLASEYSNQIGSRADALYLQTVGGQNRRMLALSNYLRDSQTTDFVNLYAWNHAVAPAIKEERSLNPFWADEKRDRVKILKRLFADTNWVKVNTVYASGRGDVSMALIKDDIGNWDLKSFDNDPGELMQAYKDVTLASLKTAASLAQGGVFGSAGGKVAEALQMTSLVSANGLGQGGAAGGFDVSRLRTRTLQNLNSLEQAADAKEKELADQLTAATKEKETKKSDADNAKTEVGKNPATPHDPAIVVSDTDKANAEAARTKALQVLTESRTTESSAETTEASATTLAEGALEEAHEILKGRLSRSANVTALADAAEKRLAADKAAAAEKAAKTAISDYRQLVKKQVEDEIKGYLAVITAMQEASTPQTSAPAVPGSAAAAASFGDILQQ